MLHITNGDSTVAGMREGGIPGEFLVWADPLHDGPVPRTGTLSELSAVRERFMAADFSLRDAVLEHFRRHEEVVLWFEHDLFDELLLSQLLAWFATQDLGRTALTMVHIDAHPEVTPFYGLGQLSGAQIARLFPARRTVQSEDFNKAHEIWNAVTSPDPTSAVPTRLLQEYPWTGDGLSRTERQILNAIAAGAHTREQTYVQSQKAEEQPWGDSSIFHRLENLMSAPQPAITADLRLTEAGKALLAGNADWIELSGGIDRWVGGVHLSGADSAWRWDAEASCLQPRTQPNSGHPSS